MTGTYYRMTGTIHVNINCHRIKAVSYQQEFCVPGKYTNSA